MMQEVFIALLSGAVTGIITVAGMRADINWLKLYIQKHDARITHLERQK